MGQNSSTTVLSVDPSRRAVSAIAMTITLLSLSMLFASLILAYTLLRLNSPAWPPMGMKKADLFFPVISSILVGLSSFSYMKFESLLKRGVYRGRFLLLTLLFGCGFLVSQIFLWNDLQKTGLIVSAGIFPSLLYGLTWIHAGHLVVALSLLLWIVLKRRNFKDRQTEWLWVKNTGQLWHFLGVIWLILFLSVFVF